MLTDLLRLMGEGGAHSYDDLAGRLGVSRPLVEAMIQIWPASATWSGCRRLRRRAACRAGCSLGGCSTGPLWTLTAKGTQAALSSLAPQ